MMSILSISFTSTLELSFKAHALSSLANSMDVGVSIWHQIFKEHNFHDFHGLASNRKITLSSQRRWVLFCLFFFYKKFMPNAKVTYSSRVLIQGMQPKDKETRDREIT